MCCVPEDYTVAPYFLIAILKPGGEILPGYLSWIQKIRNEIGKEGEASCC